MKKLWRREARNRRLHLRDQDEMEPDVIRGKRSAAIQEVDEISCNWGNT